MGRAMTTDEPPLRVWSVARDSMDYMFMTATPGADGAFVLSFNHRSGRTSFLRVGEQLGDWQVSAHTPARRKEINPRSGLVKEIDCDVVTLRSADGRERELKQGELFMTEGLRTVLIDLKSGRRHDVRVSERVEIGREEWQVNKVLPDSVVLQSGDRECQVPLISDEEVAVLRERASQVAAARRREAERLRKIEERKKAEVWTELVKIPPKRPPPEQKTFRDIEPGYFFGSYGPVPVEYTIVPPLFDNNGKMIRSAIVVPTRFETHPVSGFGNCPASRRRGISITVGR